MLAHLPSKYVSLLRLAVYLGAGIAAAALWTALPNRHDVRAQEAKSDTDVPGPSAELAPTGGAPTGRTPAANSEVRRPRDKSINIFALAVAGGIFMIPIAGMSVLAVTMTIERLLALRTQR